MGRPATPRPAYWKVVRHAFIERWRFGLTFRVFHGLGLSKFEFEFRLGFPREPVGSSRWIVYEDDAA